MIPYYHVIMRCPIFADLTEEEIDQTLTYLQAERKQYRKGTVLLPMGEKLTFFALVLDGAVEVFTDDYDGNHMIMAKATKGRTFGESLCFLERKAKVSIVASTDVELLLLRMDRLRSGEETETSLQKKIYNRFITMLAARALEMNTRIQILSKRSIRAKIVTFLSTYVNSLGTQTFTIPFDREGMADYLGCDRSALSRELAQMKAEGLLDYQRNRFTVRTHPSTDEF